MKTENQILEQIENYNSVKSQKADGWFEVTRDDFTCNVCQEIYTCRWSFSLYNTDGDCLAEK